MSSCKTPDWVASCEVCQAIWQRLTSDDKFEHTISLGSFEEALTTKCQNHKPLIEAFWEYTNDEEEENDKSGELRLEFDSGGGVVRLHEIGDHRGSVWSLTLVDKGSGYGTGLDGIELVASVATDVIVVVVSVTFFDAW